MGVEVKEVEKEKNLNVKDYLLAEIINQGFIVKAGKSYLKIQVDGWQGGVYKITLKDVEEYFDTWWGFMDTVRKIGSLYGDWRPINELAEMCLLYFWLIGAKLSKRMKKKAERLFVRYASNLAFSI
jgi:hypothetical protein